MSGGWLNAVCDLEDQGRHEEARRLYEENTTKPEREQLEAIAQQVLEAVDAHQDAIAQMRAAEADPLNVKSKAWLAMKRAGPLARDAADMYATFDDPRVRRGRRKGSGAVAVTRRLLDAMDTRMGATGEKPTTAARAVLAAHGTSQDQLKSRADYLVRLHKQRN